MPPETRRTALASAFGATLEMTREGMMELRQHEPFSPLYMRRRSALHLVEGGDAAAGGTGQESEVNGESGESEL